MTSSLFSTACEYLSRGFIPVHVPFRKKKPLGFEWQKSEPTPDSLRELFSTTSNIGILMGDRSGGLTDVDLDCIEAVKLAERFLPETGCLFGRSGKPSSHWEFISLGAVTKQLHDPLTGEMLLELRATKAEGGPGFQTVFPPSIHEETGEEIAWVRNGDPAEVDAQELHRLVCRLAVAVLVARHVPDGMTIIDTAPEDRWPALLCEIDKDLQDRALEWLEKPRIRPRIVATAPIDRTPAITAYADAALENEVTKAAGLRPGTQATGLNICAFKLGRLVGSGALDRGTVENRLSAATIGWDIIPKRGPWRQNHIEKIIKGALDAGIREPRDLSEVGQRSAPPPPPPPEPGSSGEWPNGGTRHWDVPDEGGADAAWEDHQQHSESADEPPPYEYSKDDTTAGGPSPKPADGPDVSLLLASAWVNRELAPPDYLMGELLSTTARIFIGGATGLGKTMFGLALAVHMALGKTFLHWKIARPCKVLYIDGEMSRALVKERIAAAVEQAGGLPEHLYVLCTDDYPDMPPLNTKQGQAAADAFIDAIQPDFIFFDNRMSLLAGDMKEEEPWRQTINWVRGLTSRNIGQVWFDHTGHDETRIYGTKTKEWQFDTVVMLDRNENPAVDVSFKLRFTKSRQKTPSNRGDYEGVSVELLAGQWTSTATGTTIPTSKPPSPLGQKYHEALVYILCSSTATKRQGQPCPSVTLEQWKAECCRCGLLDGPIGQMPDNQRALFNKYKQELLASGWVVIRDNACWSAKAARKVGS